MKRHAQAPLFTVKSKLFAKSTFVIGYDTAIRLIMPKYYGSEAKMLLELAAMRYRGCNLIVAGRVDEDRTFRTMSDVTLPDGLDTLVGLPQPPTAASGSRGCHAAWTAAQADSQDRICELRC